MKSTHQRVNVAVHSSDHIILPALVHGDVGLGLIVRHLVLKVVSWIFIKHLQICSCTDLGYFRIRSITKSLKWDGLVRVSQENEEDYL